MRDLAHRATLFRRRSTLVALATLLLGLAVVGAATRHMVERDRSALLERFSRERLTQLEAVAKEVEEDLHDVADDLRFATTLAMASDSPTSQRRLLEALLGAAKSYRAMVVVDASATGGLTVLDPRKGPDIPPAILDKMTELAARAAETAGRSILASDSFEVAADEWYRVFAVGFEDSSTGTRRGVSLLFETQMLMGKLRLVTSGPSTSLLVLGPHGNPSPVSSESLAEAAAELTHGPGGRDHFTALVQRMREGGSGTAVLAKGEATQLGLGDADAVVAFAAMPVEPRLAWSAATVTSMSVVRHHEQAIVRRLVLIATAVTLALSGFFAYVVSSSRRALMLEERVRHASELAHLHEKADKALENIPTAVMTLGEKGAVTAMNRALRSKLPDTPIGVPLDRAFPRAAPGALKRLKDAVDKAWTTGSTVSSIGERWVLFGDKGYYSVHAVPLAPYTSDARGLLVLDDLTELRRLESQLLRAEKLSTVGALAAGIAHEVGTPLGVVRGRAEYILGKIGEGHAQAGGLRVIMEQIDRIARTIQGLLDFSRIKPTAVSPVSITTLASKSAELLAYEAERRKVALAVEVADGLPLVAADPDQLQQVLINLLMNALDASQPGQRVVLAAGRNDSTEGARIEVIDEGHGIAPENMHRVFDPFFTTKKRGQGTGLGLTMVAQIVRSHGARLELDTAPERGTRVVLVWPTAGAREVTRAG